MSAGENSNNDDVAGPIPIRIHTANPLLYTLPQDHMTIQPYWIMIVQLIIKNIIFQRFWNRFRYGTWSTTQEIAVGHFIIRKQIEQLTKIFNFAGNWKPVLVRGRAINPQSLAPRKNTRLKFLKDRIYNVKPPMIHHVLTTNSLWHHMIKVEEISLLELQKAQMELDKYYRKLKFDFFDFAIHSLPLLGHTIWYFYIQSSCMNAERATPWNCYNAFGYRLFNYVFAPYCAFFWLVVTKIYVHHITRVEEKSQIIVPSKESNIVKIVWNKIEYHIGLWSSLLTVVVVGAPLVPYLYTNVIPMAGAYAFMGIIYILFWMCGLVFCVIVSYIPGVGRLILGIIKSLPRDDHPIAAVFLMFPFTLLTLPILLSVFFNYSQYLYYGNDYFTTMRDEFDSRDTQTYFKILQASVNERLHTSLDFI